VQLFGVQTLTLPVALTITCRHFPSALLNLTRLALAVPRGEKEIVPAFVIAVPSANGLVATSCESR
jgi:hypothetical protein